MLLSSVPHTCVCGITEARQPLPLCNPQNRRVGRLCIFDSTGCYKMYYTIPWAGIAQSVYWLVTGCTVRGSNAGGDEIFLTRPDQPWVPHSLLYNGYRVILGGKAAGAWRWPPTPSSAEVKERVELYLYSTSELVSCYRVNFTFLPLPLLHDSLYDTKT